MTTYNDLKLKELREKCDIDFAHYTYKKGYPPGKNND
jgi:hypothetical protein